MTDADRKSAEVKARRGPRTEPKVVAPPPWERDVWLDDGPIREVAEEAAERAAQPARGRGTRTSAGTEQGEAEPRRQRPDGVLDPDVAAEVERLAGPQRASRYHERVRSAFEALGRGRFDDARRMVQPVLRDLPTVAAAHEVAGLCWYGTGNWRKAIAELETARDLDHSVRHHAVLADCYRALRRYDVVERLWAELRAAGPDPTQLAEGRIVAAGARADQGDLAGALEVMDRAREVPKKVRDHHLRQWYVIADLHDRSGDVVQARRFFGLVAGHDREFADVVQRLANLGR
jgi:tetratricopeptide (TPR) repeat protein